ncbi:MAG: spermine/spermidine synthase domain-containing protein [Syntrophales bacterium]
MAIFRTTASGAGTALFMAGLVTLLGQIVIFRELSIVFHGVELIYPAALGGWMLFAAFGTLFRRSWPTENRIAALFTLFALFLLSGIVCIRGSDFFTNNIAGFSILPFKQLAILILLLPGGIISGLMFSEITSIHLETRGSPEGACAMEAAGGIAGGFLATFGIQYGFSNLFLALFCALLSFTAALLRFQRKTGRYGRFIAIALALATLPFLYKVSWLDMRMTALNHPGLFFSGDFSFGRVAATYRGGDISVFENNIVVFTTKDTEGARFAHLAAVQHPDPHRILVIGGGWDGSVRELLLHKPARIDVMLPAEDPFIRFRLPGDIRKSLANPAVHLSRADPRKFLKYKGFAWDIIIVDIAAPLSCRMNHYYTREFFESMAARLYHGGIVVIRLPSLENTKKTQDLINLASIYQALAAVFPERLILPGTTTLIASSFAPLPHSPEVLTERLRERGIKSSIIQSLFIRKLFESEDFANIKNQLQNMDSPENSALRPACYPSAVQSWADALFPQTVLSRMPDLVTVQRHSLWLGMIAGIALFLLFAVSHLRPYWQKTILKAVGGFLGITSASLLILRYGTKEGILYQQISLLLAAFMAGMALGAPLLRDLTTKTGTAVKQSLMSINRNRFWGATLLIGIMLLNAAFIGSAKSDTGNLLLTALLIAATGFLTSGLIVCASIYKTEGLNKRTFLYTSCLIGGSLGGLCAGLLLIPVFGLASTSVTLIIIAALALILV